MNLCSVGILTSLPSENVNNVKQTFDNIPRKPDRFWIPASRVETIVDSGKLSIKGVYIVKKAIDRKKTGRVTFGELTTLLRKGTAGLLPSKDADTLTEQLLVDPGPPLHERFESIPSKARVLSGLRTSFNKRSLVPGPEEIAASGIDPSSPAGQRDAAAQATVGWNELAPIAREVLTDARLSPAEVEKAVRQLPSDAPTDAQKRVDFEEW